LISLLVLGAFVERIWGAARFTIVFVLSACAGSALSSALRASSISIGASGAIFGLVGFLGVALHGGRQRHEIRALLATYVGPWLAAWFVIAVATAFFPRMRADNVAHAGGLVMGAVLGLVLTGTEEPGRPLQILALTFALSIPGAFARGWLLARELDEERASIDAIQDAIAKEKYDRAIDLCEHEIKERPQGREVPHVLYWEGVALRQLHRLDEACSILERSFVSRPNPVPAYLLAAIAIERSDTQTALAWADRADRVGSPLPATRLAVAERLLEYGQNDAALVALERARTGPLDDVDRKTIAVLESRARTRR
jgi:hypothetical protein